MILSKELLDELESATWFMIVTGGKHDLYLNNERDEILEKYKGSEVARCVGMCNQPREIAQSVKIVLK